MKECYVKYAMQAISGKWKLLILWHMLQEGVIRFNDLQRKVEGISSLMLSKSLKELEENGLIMRHQYNEIPPRVEYELSELGQKLTFDLKWLGEWGYEVYQYQKSRS